MRLIKTFFIALIFSNPILGQDHQVRHLKKDTITARLLFEDDYRLVFEDDVILRSSVFINYPSKNKLRHGYKKGLYLFGDSLTLGKYTNIVTSQGYRVIGSQQFQNIISQRINKNKGNIKIEGYQFLDLELKIVVGDLGTQKVNVMWKQNELKQKKIPIYYILEVL